MYYLLHTYIYLHYIQHIFKYQINVNYVLYATKIISRLLV